MRGLRRKWKDFCHSDFGAGDSKKLMRYFVLAARTIIVFFIAAIPGALPVQSQTLKTTADTLYFLNSDEKWCVYTNESRWRSEMAAGDTVGTIEYAGTRVSRIRVVSSLLCKLCFLVPFPF